MVSVVVASVVFVCDVTQARSALAAGLLLGRLVSRMNFSIPAGMVMRWAV